MSKKLLIDRFEILQYILIEIKNLQKSSYNNDVKKWTMKNSGKISEETYVTVITTGISYGLDKIRSPEFSCLIILFPR